MDLFLYLCRPISKLQLKEKDTILLTVTEQERLQNHAPYGDKAFFHKMLPFSGTFLFSPQGCLL